MEASSRNLRNAFFSDLCFLTGGAIRVPRAAGVSALGAALQPLREAAPLARPKHDEVRDEQRQSEKVQRRRQRHRQQRKRRQ